jgi:hypothetical protein
LRARDLYIAAQEAVIRANLKERSNVVLDHENRSIGGTIAPVQ